MARTLCADCAKSQQDDFGEDFDAIITDDIESCAKCGSRIGRDWADRDFSEPYEP